MKQGRPDSQRFDRRQLPPKPEYKGTTIKMLSRSRTKQTRWPQKVDERPLAPDWRTYISIWIRSRNLGKKFCSSLAPSMHLFVVRHTILDSMTETKTMPGRPTTWIHIDAPLVSGRLQDIFTFSSLNLETILRPFPFGHPGTTSCSRGSSRTFLENFCVEHSLNEVSSGLLGTYYHIWKCSVFCESIRRALRNWNLKLAFHSLSSIPPIGIEKKVCSLWMSC